MKPFYIYFNVQSLFDPKYFQEVIKTNLYKLDSEVLYSVIIKTKFFDGRFRVLSNQFTFQFNSNKIDDFDPLNSKFSYVFNNNNFTTQNPIDEFKSYTRPLNLEELYVYLYSILYTLNDNYDIESMEYIGLRFFIVKPIKPILKNINKLRLNKDFVNISKTRLNFSSKLLPLTQDESKYGKKMFSTLSQVRFYSTPRVYIDETNQTKIVVTELTPTKLKKEVYSLKTNKLLESVLDTTINESTFSRKIKNVELTIQDNKILKTCTTLNIPTIKPIKKNLANTFNKNIGSFDVETYIDSKSNTPQIYALGFSHINSNIDDPIIKLYYLSPNQDPSELVINCINEMLQTKYNKSIFYTHNLGGYDVVYLYKILEDYNKTNNNVYKLKPEFRDNVFLKLTITSAVSIKSKQDKPKKINKNSITFVDSLNIVPDSLDNLSKQFNLKFKKSHFPYTFVTNKTLYYKGNTPSIDYYNSPKKKMDLNIYNSLVKSDWSMVEETQYYLKNDLLSLLHIMYEFNKFIFNNLGVEVTNHLTITGISLTYFLSNHYPTDSLALLNNKSIFNDIKQAYYGGLSEVYKPYGENLYYYDVNSLYPFSSLQPMPGNKCEFIEDFSANGLDLNNLFGFFYCEIKTNKDYLGLLPYRNKGLLTHPIGEWSGWYFSSFIDFATQHGYTIKIKKGYNFNKVDNVFTSCIKKLYKIKCTSTGSKKLIAKYLLNSLLGRFGMNIDKRITKQANKKEYLNILSSHIIVDEKWISSDSILVTYLPDINYFVCKQHDTDYIKKLNTQNTDCELANNFNNVSIGVSAAITSYSSIYMSQIKLLIRSLGGNIYYMDTDSIVTDIKLPNNLVGLELGQFKLEYEIKRGYFISSKTYCLITKDNQEIIKSKGVYKESLKEQDFIDLLLNKNVQAIKSNSVKNYELGYVTIGTKNVVVNSDSYKKREKIYDQNTLLWVDTKPLVINPNLSLVLWKNMFSLILFSQ